MSVARHDMAVDGVYTAYPTITSKPLVAPVNWGMVEENVYRSGQPLEINLAFLDTLGIRTIVWLAAEEPSEVLLEWADDNDITLHQIGCEQGAKAWDTLTEESILEAINVVLNHCHEPLIMMCNLGRHRTGTVCGCLRRLQRWSLASVTEEYRRFAGPRWRVENEIMIESFNTDLITKLMKRRPAWLGASDGQMLM